MAGMPKLLIALVVLFPLSALAQTQAQKDGQTPNATAAAPPSAPASDDYADAAVHWTSTESIGTRDAYAYHLKKFPSCSSADLAKLRLAALDKGSRPPAAPSGHVAACAAGMTRDSDGDCVKAKPAKNVVARPPRPRAAEGGEATHNGHPVLDCANPAGLFACANRALGDMQPGR